MKTERELKIDAYIQQHPDAKHDGPRPVFYHGKIHQLDVFRLPTKLLVFNVGNGRFAAELMAEEKRVERTLDPTKSEDIKIISRLLLEQNLNETKILKEDLKKNGQLEPGIITFDGAIINANRRMAIFKVLHEETGEERFEYLNVHRLPRGVDEKDLWKIEAKLQFGRDLRLEYGAVNELLKIRAGKNGGLSEKQISEALAGRYSEKDVIEKLETLKLIESYLHSIKKPGEYRIIQAERTIEMFKSLQGSVISPLRKGTHKSEIPKISEIAFAMIKSEKEHTHWDIRKLRHIAELDQARNALYKVYDHDGKLTTDDIAVKDAFDGADVIVEAQKDKGRPEKLANTALSNLQQIDAKHESVKTTDFKKLIAAIQVEIDRLGGAGNKKRGKAGHQS